MSDERRYDAVLFDLDGTLIGTRRLYLECYRRALRDVIGTTYSDEEILARRPRSEFRLLLEMSGAEHREAVLDTFYAHYQALHPELYEGVFAGVHAVLLALRDAGIRMGLVTGKSRRAWEITRALGGLDGWDVLVLDDDVTEPKPDPQGIVAALTALDTPPHRAIYIGDTLSDVHAARAAGTDAAVVLWSHDPAHAERVRSRATAEGAYVLQRPAEILDLVLGQAEVPR